MITRYASKEIDQIWSDGNKLVLWQNTELAVIQARAILGVVDSLIYSQILAILESNPIDLAWWLEKDKQIKHDLNAFLEERMRFLPPELQPYFHQGMTSYDTEEPAFAKMLRDSIKLVKAYYAELKDTLIAMAIKYRYTIMNGRTHGQEAELQTFGKRCLTWLKSLIVDFENLKKAEENLKFSKLSGAIGNYGSIEPEVEKEALKILGFKPFYGATQIMPRELYAPVAQALCQIMCTLDKIANDIRLGARSGRPIYQEPFGKRQKGSSAMPHKKNTISTEQMEGMTRMAKGYFSMILENIKTWEERSIEQSCVERVAWPDLFHVTTHCLKTMKKVLEGLNVYPDNMLLEVIDSRGCYASGEAKEVLKELGLPFGLTAEEAYRIVQLAAFNVFEPGDEAKEIRDNPPKSFTEAEARLEKFKMTPRPVPISIQEIIAKGELRVTAQLEASEETVQKWNDTLKAIFASPENLNRWNQIFLPSHLLRNEGKLYQEILGI